MRSSEAYAHISVAVDIKIRFFIYDFVLIVLDVVFKKFDLVCLSFLLFFICGNLICICTRSALQQIHCIYISANEKEKWVEKFNGGNRIWNDVDFNGIVGNESFLENLAIAFHFIFFFLYWAATSCKKLMLVFFFILILILCK